MTSVFCALFDWDGVILDSSRQHEASWERLAAERGFELPPDHFKKGFGMKNEWIIPNLLGWTDDPVLIRELSLRKEALYREVIVEQGIAPLPGVREWLQTLAIHGVPCAIGSSTHRLNIEVSLAQLDLASFFQAIVTAEDVARGKPDPEVFLLAAQRLGFPASRSVVFEDALVGLEAAQAAGARRVAVATTHRAEELQHADRVVHRLDELRVEELAGWFTSCFPESKADS
ncbi:MAG: HAD family hydrolase [Candidatus Methylacidiphilales bacterium]